MFSLCFIVVFIIIISYFIEKCSQYKIKTAIKLPQHFTDIFINGLCSEILSVSQRTPTKDLYTPGLSEQSSHEGFYDKSESWIPKYRLNIKIIEEKNELIGHTQHPNNCNSFD